jgi:heme-degrading monooxygenase HmoA
LNAGENSWLPPHFGYEASGKSAITSMADAGHAVDTEAHSGWTTRRWGAHETENQTLQGGNIMYARMVSAQIQPGKMDEVINIFRDSIKPVSRQQPGYKGGYFLTNAQTGKAVSIGLWESEEAMKAGETSDYLREQVAKLAPFFAAPPVTEHYEVSLE